MADMYVKVYAGTGMTAGKIWEECVCGSLGDINIFASTQDVKNDIFKTGEYIFKISSDSIRHIAKHFGTVDDITDAIYRLYDVVCNYDNVTLVPNNQVRLKF